MLGLSSPKGASGQQPFPFSYSGRFGRGRGDLTLECLSSHQTARRPPSSAAPTTRHWSEQGERCTVLSRPKGVCHKWLGLSRPKGVCQRLGLSSPQVVGAIQPKRCLPKVGAIQPTSGWGYPAQKVLAKGWGYPAQKCLGYPA